MMNCMDDGIKIVRSKFVNKVIDINPEMEKLNNINIIKYCLVMRDSDLQYITSRYIKDIFNTYESAHNIDNNKKYIEIFMN